MSNRLRVFVVSDPLLAENFTVRPANSGEEMTVWVVISLARHGLTAIFLLFLCDIYLLWDGAAVWDKSE